MKTAFALALALVLLAALPPAGAEASRGGAPPATTQGERTIYDLNTVNLDELMSLKGIGPALARRILEERTRRGSFTSIEELLLVKGIGEKNLARLRDHFTISNQPARTAKTTPAAR